MKYVLWEITKVTIFPLLIPIFVVWFILIQVGAIILMLSGAEPSTNETSLATKTITWLYNEFIEDGFITAFWFLAIIALTIYVKVAE